MTPTLFDLADYSPLVAGVPVPAAPERQVNRRQTTRQQQAMCCGMCGTVAEHYITTTQGNAVCLACARKLQKGS